MNLKEKLLYSSFEYKDDVLYKVIEDFHFFYLKLSNKKEVIAICLNKALLHKNDLKVINKKFKGVARIYSDNLLLRNDVIYIDLLSSLIHKLVYTLRPKLPALFRSFCST